MKRLLASFALSLAATAAFAEDDKAPKKAETPEAAFDAFKEAIRSKDAERFWTILSAASRKVLEEMGEQLKEEDESELAAIAKEAGVTLEDFLKLSAREVITKLVFAKENDENGKKIEEMKLSDVKVDGDAATATRMEGEAKKNAFFIREDGEWKIDVARELLEEKKESEPPPDPGGHK